MNEELKHKLFEFEAKPPAMLWDKIAEALDDEIVQEFPERLYHFEAKPPANVWEKIETALDKRPAMVVPIIKRYPKIFKYGSAAAVLFALALCANLFLNKRAIGESNSATSNQSMSSPSILTPSKGTKNTDASGLVSVTSNLRDGYERKFGLGNPLVPLKAKRSFTSFNQRTKIIVPRDLPVIQSTLPDRYIVFSKATGDVVRLSKKLFSLFACSDKFEDCRQDIQSVQQQLASPTMMASTDFNGILDLLQNMNTQ